MQNFQRCIVGQSTNHLTWLDEHTAIHQDVAAPFLAMKQAAENDGIQLKIASSFRSFQRQLTIWNNKFSGKTPVKNSQNKLVNISSLTEKDLIHAIMLYSALPGASRHHWGTDIDIYADNVLAEGESLALEPWEYQKKGPFYPLSKWLEAHALEYGFFFPYQKYTGGIAAEPWHLSYKTLADDYQQQCTIALLTEVINNCDILGKATLLAILPELYSRYIKR